MLLLFTEISFGQYTEKLIIEPLLKTDTTYIGQKIKYPQFEHNEVTILKITMKPGTDTGWHKHGIPLFAYVMQGTLSVELEDGRKMQFNKDSAIAEGFDDYHIGKNEGSEDVVLIAIYLGGKNVPISTPKY